MVHSRNSETEQASTQMERLLTRLAEMDLTVAQRLALDYLDSRHEHIARRIGDEEYLNELSYLRRRALAQHSQLAEEFPDGLPVVNLSSRAWRPTDTEPPRPKPRERPAHVPTEESDRSPTALPRRPRDRSGPSLYT